MNSNQQFLAKITVSAKNQILASIANHYGISVDEAEEEVCDSEAESLIDYMTGPERVATSVLMQKYGFR